MWWGWLAQGLRISIRVHPGWIGVACAYAVACWGARTFSHDPFYLPAGIRVFAVLLTPPRRWPYLLLGEYAYFAEMRVPMITQYGLAWVLLGSMLLMPAVMLIVHIHRRTMNVGSVAWLLSVAASSAGVVTIINLGLSRILWPTPPSTPLHDALVRFLIGDFIGILMIAPLALLWIRRHIDASPGIRHVGRSTFAFASMVLIGLGAYWIPSAHGILKANALLMMALPAIALTCLHGWRGAAIGVATWGLMMRLTMSTSGLEGSFEPLPFPMQQSFVVVGISLLAVGSTLSYYSRKFMARDQDGRKAASLARITHIATEMDLRTRALDIRKLGDGLEHSLDDLSDWLDMQGHQDLASSLRRVSAVHSRKFREQITMVYPTSLEHVGLYLALQTGGIHEAWKNTDRLMLHRLGGDPCQLSIGLQLATYRSIAEAVSLLLQHEPGQIHISARCGRFRRDRGILVAVALLDTRRHLSDVTMTLALERLTGRTLAYGGTVQCRRNRVRILLLEPRPDVETARHFRFPVHGTATTTR